MSAIALRRPLIRGLNLSSRHTSLIRATGQAVTAAAALVFWYAATLVGSHGDLLAYWNARVVDPYGGVPGQPDYYAYSPAFAQAFSILHALPFGLVVWLWAALLLASLAFCARRWTWLVILAPPVIVELGLGNLNLMLAAAIVIGFRWPAAWSALLLTKVTPGIGLLWFAVRREWHLLAIALGVTAAVAAVSFAMAPGLWADWFGALTDAASVPAQPSSPLGIVPVPLIVRLPIAIVVVVWGALTDRRWTVALAATLAIPVLWTPALSMSVAVMPLVLRPTASPEPEAGRTVEHAISPDDRDVRGNLPGGVRRDVVNGRA